MIAKLAFQNLLRNRRRTLSTALTITAGVVVIVFLGAMLKGMAKNWARLQIESVAGAIQIEHVNYESEAIIRPLETTIVNSSDIIEKIKSTEGVVSAFGKLRIAGVISSGSKSTVFDGSGVDMNRLKETLPISDNLIIQGEPLGDDSFDVVLGEYLAADLGLSIGDPVIIAVRTYNGVLDIMYGKLVGIKNGPHFPAATYVEMNLSQAQNLLRMEDRVSQILVRIEDQSQVKQIAAKLNAALTDISTPIRLKQYPQLIQNYASVTTSMNTVSYILGIILLIVVGGGIANMMYMTVRERRKEIGTVMAIGMKYRLIRRLFVFEGAYIGIIGALIGLVIASILVLLITALGGIPIKEDIRLVPILDAVNMTAAIVLALLISVLATWFPAVFSTKLNAVECLYEH